MVYLVIYNFLMSKFEQLKYYAHQLCEVNDKQKKCKIYTLHLHVFTFEFKMNREKRGNKF